MNYMSMSNVQRMKSTGLNMDEVEILSDMTAVGDYVVFERKDINPRDKIFTKKIEGFVVAKYKHIFLLHTGKSYTWKDYLLGCSDEIRKHVITLYKLKMEFEHEFSA